MSDAFLDSTLSLDIRAALAQVDKLNADLARATTDIRITADTRAITASIDAAVQNSSAQLQVVAAASPLTSSIDAAVEAADAAVVVTADAREVTGEITGAVEAADTAVVVTGEATELTGEIDAAVQAADTAVTITGTATELTGDVNAAITNADTDITITGTVAPDVAFRIKAIKEETEKAKESSDRLKQALIGIGIAGVVKGLYEMATAASNLGESSSKAATVFGDSFGDIERFSLDAATAVGLSQAAALEATGTFGNLFQALGATQEVAADLSPKVVQVAADLASFNNLGVDETLEKLRSGLVGEIEPLRGLGISFGAAEVDAKAFELGLANAGDTVTEGAKLQARFALIMEQSTIAQGDFARTSAGLANQQRILNAEWDNAVTVAGQALLPTLLDLVAVGRNDLIPAFTDLATEVLPPFASIIADLAPLLGISVQLLVAAAPALAAVAGAVDAIPTPLLVVIGAFVTMNKLMPAVSTQFDKFAFKAYDAAGGLGAFNPFLVVGAVALAGFADRAAFAAERKRQFREAVTNATAALTDEEGTLRVTTEAVQKYIDTMTGPLQAANTKLHDALSEVGFDLRDLTDAALDGEDGQKRFGAALDAAGAKGAVADALRNSFDTLQGSLEQVTKDAIEAARASGAISDAQANAALASDDMDGALRRLQGTIDRHNAAVESATTKYGPQIAAAQALGTAYTTLAEDNEDLADRITHFSDAGFDADVTLGKLIVSLGEATLSEQEMGAAAALLGTDAATLTTLIDDVTGAVNDFVDTAVGGLPQVQDAFEAAGAGGVTKFVDNLTGGAGGGGLTDKVTQFMADLQTIFAAGGKDIAGLLATQGFEAGGAYARELAKSVGDGTTSALVTTTEAAVDAHNGALQQAEVFLREQFGPAYIASTGLIASLASEALGSNLSFAERTRIAANLATTTLDEEGRAIALIAATEGAEAAEAYASLFKISDVVLAEGIAAGATLSADPGQVVPAAGKVGGDAKAQFNVSFGGMAQFAAEESERVAATMRTDVGGVLPAATNLGASGKALFTGALSGMALFARDEVSASASAIAGGKSAVANAAKGTATAGVDEFGRPFATGVGEGTRGAIAAGVTALNIQKSILSQAASATGYAVGQSFGQGMQNGIESYTGRIAASAAAAVRAAEREARKEAQSQSPSKLFARLGLDLGRGIGVGLDQSGPGVAARAAAAVAEAAQAAQAAVAGADLTIGTRAVVEASLAGLSAMTVGQFPVSALAVPAVAAAGVGVAGGGTVIQIGNIRVEVPLVPGMSRDEVAAQAEVFADSLMDRLLSTELRLNSTSG